MIGRHHEDALLLDLARIVEQERPWPLVAPADARSDRLDARLCGLANTPACYCRGLRRTPRLRGVRGFTVTPPGDTGAMERQLKLLETDALEPEWQLDDTTKEVGKRGVAAARAALQQARRQARVTPDRRHDAA